MDKNLTPEEKAMIVAALYACSPSGGGSTQFHLACRLANEWKVGYPDDLRLIGQLQTVAHEEYVEAHASSVQDMKGLMQHTEMGDEELIRGGFLPDYVQTAAVKAVGALEAAGFGLVPKRGDIDEESVTLYFRVPAEAATISVAIADQK